MCQQLMIWRKGDTLDHPSACHVCGSSDPVTICFSDHTSTQTYTHIRREDIIFLIMSKYLLPIYRFTSWISHQCWEGFCRTKKKESFSGTAGLKLLFFNENSQAHLQWPSWQASHRLQSGQGFLWKLCAGTSLCSKSVYNLEEMELSHLM